MKLLVGILVTVENEYRDCVASIRSQNGVDYDIYEIKNKPKNVAHNLLYYHFIYNSYKYDLLIKVDADMVIEDKELFTKIVIDFSNNEYLDHLFIPTYDHFVCKNLGGVNVYRNSVRWNRNKNNYFTDRIHKSETIRESKKWFVPEDKPLIHHCPNPSSYQAFHFGLHRTIKAFQFGRAHKKYQNLHWIMFSNVKRNYFIYKDRKYLLALAGAVCAISEKLKDSDINYNNKRIYKIYQEINRRNDDELYDYAINNIYMRMLSIFGKLSYYIIALYKK